MNTHLHLPHDPQRSRLEADLAARVAVLFRDCPELSGFTVQEATPMPANIVYCMPVDVAHAEDAISTVSHMLLELLDEEPEAAELVLGRTFARTLH